jgi:hypothetical protein
MTGLHPWISGRLRLIVSNKNCQSPDKKCESEVGFKNRETTVDT